MAALNFPNSPSLNDTHTENGVTFKWNGAAWDRLGDIGAQGSAGAAGAQGSAGAQGATGSTGAQGSTGPVAGSSNQVVYKDGSNNPAGSTNFTFDGTNLTVSGNLNVGGVLTYEDVTNVDSVGFVTATGLDINGSGDISGPLNVSGNATFHGNLDLHDNDILRIGTGDDLQIYHDGSHTYANNTTGYFHIRSGSEIRLQKTGGERMIYAIPDGAVELYYDDTKKFETTSGGVNVTGELQANTLDINGAADISSHLTLHGNLDMQDNDEIRVGTGDDLKIYHDGSNTYIKEQGTGSLIIETTGANIDLKHGSEYLARFKEDAEVELYYDNSLKLETKSDGVDITGELLSDSLKVYSGNTGTVDIADFYTSNNGSGGSNCRLKVRTYPNAGGDPFIFFDGGGTNFVVGEQWNGTTNNILRLGAGNDMSSVDGIDITSGGDIKLTKSPDPRIYANTNVGLNIDGMALYLNRYVSSHVVSNLGGGSFGIGEVPATGDGGNSNYNNWDTPKLHVKGANTSGKFHLLGRFVSGVDADSTGAQIVIHHENDRGMALQGGRSSGNKSYGAIKSLDNLARESNVMVFTGGTGQGVENIKFYTNGSSTGTNERMSINSYGTVHTGGSAEITQSSLTPDLITQAGCVSPLFYRPFQSMSGAPSTSGPGYVDFGTGGVRHNLTDPHLGASYGGSQFQGGLINSYSQTFSNTASGTTREAMNWNRFRILFRGLCLSTGHTPPTVKFRYSTYHYSNGWQDHSGTEWSFNGTEQARGGRWVVGPWINPSSYFTSWSDVPGFGLYYNDNSSGKTFRIAGGVYFQYAHFI